MRPPENRPALLGLIASIFVSGTGIGSLLPILPLYLRERGASYALVGVIVGAALVAQAIGQWPAGIAAERVGPRAMMIGGLLVAAAASVAFILPLLVEWLIGLRFVQGLGFAAVIPSELAAVASVVRRDRLGRAYGWIFGAQQAGFIAGPAIGGLLAVFGRWAVFAVTGRPCSRLRASSPSRCGTSAAAERSFPKSLRMRRAPVVREFVTRSSRWRRSLSGWGC